MRARCSLLTEPWWARARIGGAPADAPAWAISWAGATAPGSGSSSSSRSAQISLSRAVSRSASRRELAKTMVERCAAIRSTTRSSTWGQIEARGGSPRRGGPVRSPVGCPSSPRSGTGTTTRRSNALSARGWTTVTGRPPARNRATSPPGARSPTARSAGPAARAGRRAARGSARGGRRAWCPRPRAPRRRSRSRRRRRTSRAREVSIRNSDSGVVIRMSGGVRGNGAGARPGCRRSGRRPDLRLGLAEPDGRVPHAGQRRAQVALDVDRQRLHRGDVEHPAPALRLGRGGVRRQPVERPEEGGEGLAGAGRRHDQGVVAAADRLPRTRPGRASAAAKAPSNHARVAGENASSTPAIGPSSLTPPTPGASAVPARCWCSARGVGGQPWPGPGLAWC